MYNLMMAKQDHYLHMRKALLSTAEFVFIHTPGLAEVDAPLASVEPSRPAEKDVYGNMRQYYPAEKFDEVSLRLAFEQGWEEEKYIPYSSLQSQKKAEAAKKMSEPASSLSASMKSVSKQAGEFHKLLESIGPALEQVEKSVAAKKVWAKPSEHIHWAENSYHNLHMVEYSQADYFSTAEVYEKTYHWQMKPTPMTMKDFYEISKSNSYEDLASQLASFIYDDLWEKKYSVTVQVLDEPMSGLYKIVVFGTNGLDYYKMQYLVPNYEAFYQVQESVVKMKMEVIKNLQDKDAAHGTYF